MEFDNLGQLSQRLSLMSNQAYGFKKDSRFAKHNDIADIYNQFLERADQGEEVHDDEEIAAAEMVWGKEPLTVNQRWIKQAKGTYNFDVTKADKLFEFLVRKAESSCQKGILCFGLMELKRKDIVDFMTGTLTPSMIAGFSG
jgi:hypothetical protein